MKRRVTKWVIAIVLSFSLLAVFGRAYSDFANKGQTSRKCVMLLKSWYEDYKSGEFEENLDDSGSGAQLQASLLGSKIFFVTSRNGSKVTTSWCSIGYRATKVINGYRTYGFVTCAHGIYQVFKDPKKGYRTFYTDGNAKNKLGTLEVCKFNSTMDASYVSVASSSTISSKTRGNASISAQTCTVSSGQTVTKCGAATGTTSGKVYGTDSYYWDFEYGVDTDGLIETEYISQLGDSGSVVYRNVGGVNKVVGIIKAGNSFAGVSYVVKASKINSALGVSMY